MTRKRLLWGLGAAAVVGLILGATFWIGLKSNHPAELLAGPNVQVDAGISPPGVVPQQGVEPYVAALGNGTIGVAWIGVLPVNPTQYFGQSTNLTLSIWFAWSYNDGASFTQPRSVSENRSNCVDPSVAFAPNGTVYVVYLCTPSSNHSIWLASARTGQSSFVSTLVTTGPYLDRPWVALSSSGVVSVAYENEYSIPKLTQATLPSLAFGPASTLASTQALVTSMIALPSGMLAIGLESNYGVSATLWSPSSGPAAVDSYFPTNDTGSLGAQEPLLSQPGPAVAYLDGGLYLAYVSNSDSSLLLRVSADGGATWGPPMWVELNATGPLAMPTLAGSDKGGFAVLTWLDGSSGNWSTKAVAYTVATSSLSRIVTLSSRAGYPSSVRSWHGDFMGSAVSTGDQACVVWSDGRGGLSTDVGYGHIYAGTVAYLPGVTAIPSW